MVLMALSEGPIREGVVEIAIPSKCTHPIEGVIVLPPIVVAIPALDDHPPSAVETKGVMCR